MSTFNAVFGVNPGYGDDIDQGEDWAIDKVASAWDVAMTKESSGSGITVSAVLSLVRVVYPKSPYGGEVAVQATGVLNPKFVKDGEAWKAAVCRIIIDVKNRLKQERVTLFFQDVERFQYFEQGEVV